VLTGEVFFRGHTFEVVRLGNGVSEADLVVHDETDPALAFLLSQMGPPRFPTPVGVFHAVERATYEDSVKQQILSAKQKLGEGTLDALFTRGDTWTVR